MQTIEGTIKQKRAEISKLLEDIELLEKAQGLLGTEPVKRKGRPKGSKNQAVKAESRKKAGRPKGVGRPKKAKGSKKRGRKAGITVETPGASS
jgi:hypothetical protein